jgi:hypothetical protein
MEINRPKSNELKMRWCKLKSVVNWQGMVKQLAINKKARSEVLVYLL